ncbi:MAG: phosphoglycerate dehydrogenase, partial [Sphingomonadales bacterium]
APKLRPYMKLAAQLGSFAGQLTESRITKVTIEYEGEVADLNVRPLTAIVLEGLLKPLMDSVNMVNAPGLARERDIEVAEVKLDREGDYHTLVRLTVTTEKQERSLAGTLFSDGGARLVEVKGINIEAQLCEHMLYTVNDDLPGFIGNLGSVLGNAGLNIATFNLGRAAAGKEAIALVALDQAVADGVLKEVRALPHVKQAKVLRF